MLKCQLFHSVLHEFIHFKKIIITIILVYHEYLYEILEVVCLLEENIGQLQFADGDQTKSHWTNSKLELTALFRLECTKL